MQEEYSLSIQLWQKTVPVGGGLHSLHASQVGGPLLAAQAGGLQPLHLSALDQFSSKKIPYLLNFFSSSTKPYQLVYRKTHSNP